MTRSSTSTVRVTDGDYLTFTGGSGGGPPTVNQGTISLIGGSIEFHDPVINEIDATVSGHGALMFNHGLTNRGAVNLSNDTEVYGEVVNGQVGAQAAYGEIVVSNDATVGFHGRVIHNGTKFKVSENANVAFFGLVTGAGDFTGGGGIFFEAGYSPGNSPAWIDADADLTYGPDSINTMELGGYTEVQYDIVNMTDGGTLELNGTLNVELLDGFLPDATATFDIYRFASGDRSGSFDVVNLPQPMLDLGFDIFYLDTSVRLMSLSAAVPEPTTLNLIIVGGMVLGLLALKRKRGFC